MIEPEGILRSGVGECVTRTAETNQVSSVQDMSPSSGGLVRGWKHLAREKAAMEQVSFSLVAKRGIQECLEGMKDLVPTKP